MIIQQLYVDITRNLESDTSNYDSSRVFFIWVAVLSVILILCPFIVTERRRKLCRRRIIERRWNVEENASRGAFIRSYPIGDPRHQFTVEQYFDETKNFIEERLSPFTKELEPYDFFSGDDIESKLCLETLCCERKNDELRDAQTEHSSEDPSDHTLHDTTKINFEKYTTAYENSLDQSSNKSHIFSEQNLPRKSNDEDKIPTIAATEELGTGTNDNHPSDTSTEEQDIETNEIIGIKSLTTASSSWHNSETTSISLNNESMQENVKFLNFKVPAPSVLVSSSDNHLIHHKSQEQQVAQTCCVRAECSICLNAYFVGDKVSWSQNCQHVFHYECICEWLTTLAKKDVDNVAERDNTLRMNNVCRFSMVCPVCRQDFIPNASQT
mmetsp:Transcript_1933/g.2594  ORF Transcript_1933/g.2594 Transcript_1933/m.2594 type:complete len:383 (+) Transcript_1933:176-1324(+)